MGLATAFDPFNNATEPTTKDMLILWKFSNNHMILKVWLH
jgi:hypothetical protein